MDHIATALRSVRPVDLDACRWTVISCTQDKTIYRQQDRADLAVGVLAG
jgi:hypothetical protein